MAAKSVDSALNSLLLGNVKAKHSKKVGSQAKFIGIGPRCASKMQNDNKAIHSRSDYCDYKTLSSLSLSAIYIKYRHGINSNFNNVYSSFLSGESCSSSSASSSSSSLGIASSQIFVSSVQILLMTSRSPLRNNSIIGSSCSSIISSQ